MDLRNVLVIEDRSHGHPREFHRDDHDVDDAEERRAAPSVSTGERGETRRPLCFLPQEEVGDEEVQHGEMEKADNDTDLRWRPSTNPYKNPQDGSFVNIEVAIEEENQEIHHGHEQVQHDVEEIENGVERNVCTKRRYSVWHGSKGCSSLLVIRTTGINTIARCNSFC